MYKDEALLDAEPAIHTERPLPQGSTTQDNGCSNSPGYGRRNIHSSARQDSQEKQNKTISPCKESNLDLLNIAGDITRVRIAYPVMDLVVGREKRKGLGVAFDRIVPDTGIHTCPSLGGDGTIRRSNPPSKIPLPVVPGAVNYFNIVDRSPHHHRNRLDMCVRV